MITKNKIVRIKKMNSKYYNKLTIVTDVIDSQYKLFIDRGENLYLFSDLEDYSGSQTPQLVNRIIKDNQKEW